MPREVLVLNTTFEPINVCSTRRAVVLLLKGRAEALETGPAEPGTPEVGGAGGLPAGD